MSVPTAYICVILIWSTTPLAIQWSSEGGGYLFGVTARMALGLLFCLLAIRFSGVAMPWHGRARGTYLAAGLGIYGSMSLVYWGAQYVPSGWIAVLCFVALYKFGDAMVGVMATPFYRSGWRVWVVCCWACQVW